MYKNNVESKKILNKCLGTIHVVRKGDTLYRISKKYGVGIPQLMLANPYVNVYNLQVGDELCISTISSVAAPTPLPQERSQVPPIMTLPEERPQVPPIMTLPEERPQVPPIMTLPEERPQVPPIMTLPEERPQVPPIMTLPEERPQVPPIMTLPEERPQVPPIMTLPEERPQVPPIMTLPEERPQVPPIMTLPEERPQVTPPRPLPEVLPHVISTSQRLNLSNVTPPPYQGNLSSAAPNHKEIANMTRPTTRSIPRENNSIPHNCMVRHLDYMRTRDTNYLTGSMEKNIRSDMNESMMNNRCESNHNSMPTDENIGRRHGEVNRMQPIYDRGMQPITASSNSSMDNNGNDLMYNNMQNNIVQEDQSEKEQRLRDMKLEAERFYNTDSYLNAFLNTNPDKASCLMEVDPNIDNKEYKNINYKGTETINQVLKESGITIDDFNSCMDSLLRQ